MRVGGGTHKGGWGKLIRVGKRTHKGGGGICEGRGEQKDTLALFSSDPRPWIHFIQALKL